MDWHTLSNWQNILKETGFRIVTKPQSLKKIKIGELAEGSFFTLAFEDNLPVVVHASFSTTVKHSDVKSYLRRAYGQGIATSPCIISYGDDHNLGIFVCTDQEEEAFQFLNLAEPEAFSDTLKDIRQAASKQTIAEKVATIYKALDFEALSRRFFDSAKECKELFESDIFTSTRMARNEQNELSVSHYSIIVMARLIFLHFLEQKSLINHDSNFIRRHVLGDDDAGVEASKALWSDLFKPLFEILNLPIDKRRGQRLNKFRFPYLNGGLFACYESIEAIASFDKLKISDAAIRSFYEKCLYKYRMTTSEDAAQAGQKGVLDPELLGTIFERFMKDDVSSATGSVYTPKDVVLFSVRNALTRYFLGAGLPDKTAFDLVHHKSTTKQFADTADSAFSKLRLTDPCCGSGAFLLTSLHELFEIKRAIRLAQGKERWHNGDQRKAYESILRENIYGLDINPEAIILCHLRLWLPIIDLIDGNADYEKIRPLPNLGLNIRCGNSLTNEKADWESPSWQPDDVKTLSALRNEYFSCESPAADKIIRKFDEISNQDDSYVRLSRNFLDITMSQDHGFSVIVGNPPYLGLKDVKKIDYLKNWEEISGGEIADMYIMFTKESLKALSNGGVLSYVTSNTYFTDSGKEAFRKLLLGESKEFPTTNLTITDLSPKTFKGVGVNAAIFTFNKRQSGVKKTDTIRVIHSKGDSKAINSHIAELNDDPATYARRDGNDLNHIFTDVPVSTINLVPRQNIFIPNRERIDFLNRFGAQWKNVYDEVWPLIETSKKAEQNSAKLAEIRKKLQPFDLTLIGLVCDGGVGLQTGCNAIHLAILDGTDEADRIRAKIDKIKSDIRADNKAGKKAKEDIAEIQDTIKVLRKNGHPYAEVEYSFVYKIIRPDQILDVSKLTEADFDTIQEQGISRKMAKTFGVKYPTYVPYYKGQDSDFNRWHSRVDFYIDWSEDNVKWMKNNSGKKFQGAPVVRNPQFYFKSGLCWNLIKSDLLQSRVFNEPGVNDVGNMKLSPLLPSLSDKYICAYLNSSTCASLIEMVTNTVNVQINDIKMLPIIIPDKALMTRITKSFDAITNVINAAGTSLESRKEKVDRIETQLNAEFDSLFAEYKRVG